MAWQDWEDEWKSQESGSEQTSTPALSPGGLYFLWRRLPALLIIKGLDQQLRNETQC